MSFLWNELVSTVCVLFPRGFLYVYICTALFFSRAFWSAKTRSLVQLKKKKNRKTFSTKKKIQFILPTKIFRIFPLSHPPCDKIEKKEKERLSWFKNKTKKKQSLKSFCSTDGSPKSKQYKKCRPTSTIILELHELYKQKTVRKTEIKNLLKKKKKKERGACEKFSYYKVFLE